MAKRATSYLTEGYCEKRRCKNCVLADICGGCENGECLVYLCSRGYRYVGITYPTRFCYYRDFCHGVFDKKIERPKIPEKMFNQSNLELPRYIPIIKVSERDSWFWEKLNHPALIVKLEEFLLQPSLLNEVAKCGLHDFLGFNGIIILSSIMPDEILDKLSGREYGELVEKLKPDAFMFIDDYTYIDDPYLISWRNLFRLFQRTLEMKDIEAYPIGLIKGASRKQIAWCIESLVKMGIRTFAFPCRNLPTRYVYQFLESIIFKLKGLRSTLIIYGSTILPRQVRQAIKEKAEEQEISLCYASMTWYINAKYGIATYKGRNYQLPLNISYNCNCQFCRDKPLHILANDVKSLALHNLSQIISYHDGSEEWELDSVEGSIEKD